MQRPDSFKSVLQKFGSKHIDKTVTRRHLRMCLFISPTLESKDFVKGEGVFYCFPAVLTVSEQSVQIFFDTKEREGI